MFTRLLFITTVLFVQPGVVAFSFNSTGGVASPSSIFDSFYAEEALNVTLTTDLDALINDRRRKDYLEATLSYKDRTGARVNWNLKVKPRG